LPALNKICHTKKKEVVLDYKKQTSALLHQQAYEIKITPLHATMNTVWQLLHNYKYNEAAGKPQLPSKMWTNKSADKRLWWPGDIQRDPTEGIHTPQTLTPGPQLNKKSTREEIEIQITNLP